MAVRVSAPPGPDAPPQPRGTPGVDVAIVAAICLGYLAVAWWLRQPFVLSDQIHYLHDASTLPHVNPIDGEVGWHRALRLGLLIPVRGLIAVFGYSPAAYYLPPLLAGCGLIAGTYALAKMWAGRAAAAGAAVLVVANPWILGENTTLLPDLPAAAMLTGAFVLVWWTRTIAPGRTSATRAAEGGPSDRVAAAALIATGVLLGWSYLTREFAVVWWPLVALLLVGHAHARRWKLIAAPVAAAFVFEWVWGLVFHGNPLQRIVGALTRPPSPPWRQEQVAQLREQGLIQDVGPGDILVSLPKALIDDAGVLGWLWLGLVAVVLVAALTTRRPQLRLAALWLIVPWVVITAVAAASSALTGTPLLRTEKVRYWLALWPPLTAGVCATVALLARRRPDTWRSTRSAASRMPATGRRGSAALAVTALVLPLSVLGLSAATALPGQVRDDHPRWEELRDFLAGPGAGCQRLYVDAGHWRATSLVLPLSTVTFTGKTVWDGEVAWLNRGGGFDAWRTADSLTNEGGVVVIHRLAVTRLQIEQREAPGYLTDPPGAWTEVFVSSDAQLRLLATTDDAC